MRESGLSTAGGSQGLRNYKEQGLWRGKRGQAEEVFNAQENDPESSCENGNGVTLAEAIDLVYRLCSFRAELCRYNFQSGRLPFQDGIFLGLSHPLRISVLK